jgi:DNA-binding NtrC family response regulator
MATREGRRVLLIDDDRWVRALFTDVLAAMGCEVRVAGSGEEGLALLDRGDYHLIIADLAVGAGEMRGAFQAHAPGIPIIIMAGSGSGRGEAGQGLPGCTVLAKPVRLPTLQEAIVRALER